MTEKPADHALVWSFLRWLMKVVGAAAIGGVTGAFAFYATWTGMQSDIKAQGATITIHTKQIEALQEYDASQAIVHAGIAATTAAERDATKEQLRQIREDLQFIQRELIGRTRRP